MVWAVIVTYNRLDLLKKVLDALRQQTYTIEKIIIIRIININSMIKKRKNACPFFFD